ncbi:MAG TPA: hypothetical protein VHG09_08165 [Longimicrobiales bacterium]|nr:hypothetical protein [Longimicrobiales bacterium]
MRYFRSSIICGLAFLLGAVPALAQGPLASQTSAQISTLVPGVSDSAVLASLEFRSIGPALISGRISDIAVPPAQRPGERLGKTVCVASAAGGVWKTTNAGVTWTPIFDDQRVSSIGAVAVAPSDPDVVWVGTGESNNLRSSSWGEGIYRSDDAGETWTHMGLRESQHIARIVIHPRNARIVYVAAMGPLWGDGGERGLYRTTDGGRTWELLLSAGPFTGVTDVILDPRDPNVMYAATYQRERKSYSFVAGGPESGIWKSIDGGDNWTRLETGLPEGDKGRIGIDIARSQPSTIYATVSAEDGGIFRSDDAGATWTRTSELQSIPWFFGQIRVDPLDPERVYHLGVQLQVSDDGGRTFENTGRNTHADHHAMWIDPMDSDHLIDGNDGGIYFSDDRGSTWDFSLNLPVSTFYAIGVDMRDPYWVYGGTQDNGTWGAPTRTLGRSGATNYDWVRAGGGDGFYAAIDPTDHNVVYLESQNGSLRRFDFATQEAKGIRPEAAPGEDLRYNWSAPVLMSPHDNRTLYFGANVLFRTDDRGDTWERVSGDLTRNLDRDELPIMDLEGPGGFGRHEGTADFGNLSTIDESPITRGLIYVGTDDGLVQVTRDGGSTWTKIDEFPGVPELTYVSRVIASAHDEGTVYVTFDGHRSNDFRSYVLKSTDYGRTFTSIADGLGDAGSVYVIREHHRNPNLLVVGAEYGVFVTVDGGRTWTQLRNGIPPAPVHDLVIHPRENDIVVGTHGRGIFVLDDITALENLANARGSIARLFEPRPAMLYNPRSTPSIPGHRNYSAENPAAGASLTYFVGPDLAAGAHATLAIMDGDGNLVRELPAELDAGVHRAVWDMRHTAPALPTPPVRRGGGDDEEEEEEEEEEDRRFGRGGPTGPRVVPGTYTVQLLVAEDPDAQARVVSESRLDVRLDPDVALAGAELQALFDARRHAYRQQLSIQQLVGRLDQAKADLEGAVEGKADATTGVSDARALMTDLDTALNRLRPPPRRPGSGFGGRADADGPEPLLARVNDVANAIGSAHFAPTPEQLATLAEVEADLERQTAAIEALLSRAASVAQTLSAQQVQS